MGAIIAAPAFHPGSSPNLACSSPHGRSFLLRVGAEKPHPKFARPHYGSCLSTIKATGLVTPKAATFDEAIVFTKTATNNVKVRYGGYGCTTAVSVGAGNLIDSGFVFTGSGTTDCGGTVSSPPNGSKGLQFGSPSPKAGWQVLGIYHSGKRNWAGQFQGPFTDAACLVSNPVTNMDTIPIVVPLEDSTATPTAFNETATTTTAKCSDFADTHTATNANVYTVQTTATPGQFTITYAKGAGGTWTSVTSCAVGTGVVHAVTYEADIRGHFTPCVQAKDETNTNVAFYYRLDASLESQGEWPNMKALPSTPACTSAPGPAAGLQVTAALAAALAFIALLM